LYAVDAAGVGYYVTLSWLPTYYNQAFGVDVQQSALLSVLPWCMTILASTSAGWIADHLASSGRLSLTRTRKVMQVIGSAGPAMCLLYLAHAHDLDVWGALGLMTGTLALGGVQAAGFASNHQDISSRYAPVLFGITNALSSLMGTCSVYATGVILDATSSWALVFNVVAGFYLLGALSFLSWGSGEQQFD
jgi:ACS family sodium-dependent inorganic phosphate cotransporter